MKRINIMTSCDNNLALYILPQIASIGESLSGCEVYFYLFHNRIKQENISFIKNYAEAFANIKFHEIFIENTAPYEEFAKHGGNFPYEAYLYFLCHEHLPESMDRILYIDAADIIINGNIDEYYFADFEGKAMVATHNRLKTDQFFNHTVFEKEDMLNLVNLKSILRGAMNSGSFVINLENFRERNLTENNYYSILHLIREIIPNTEELYYGDQGLFSVAFVGEVKYFGAEGSVIKNTLFKPYNCVASFSENLLPPPIICHFAAAKYKPWEARVSPDILERFKDYSVENIINHIYRIPEHFNYFEIWWKYCEKTPIYEDAHIKVNEFTKKIIQDSI